MVENKEFTILIADDEKINLDVLGQILSPNYNLLIAKNGARALELAKLHSPDLILLDVLMPGMTGFEVISKLKETDATNKIPVIFITGLTSVEDEEKGFFLGAVDYITKPFNKVIVKARVNTHIRIVDQMRTIERIGLIDPLTKISNRRGFEYRLRTEWGRAFREQTPINVMILDVDKFKIYNDTYGHQQGDKALQAVAETFSQSLRRTIDFAARWGGEEFIGLLPNNDIDGIIDVAEQIRANIAALVIPTDDRADTKVTASIGVNSVVPTADTSVTDFIAKADQALYRAKAEGRNRVCFST